MLKRIEARLLVFWLSAAAGAVAAPTPEAGRAPPAEVIVGSCINKVQDVSFFENRYTVDFHVWSH